MSSVDKCHIRDEIGQSLKFRISTLFAAFFRFGQHNSRNSTTIEYAPTPKQTNKQTNKDDDYDHDDHHHHHNQHHHHHHFLDFILNSKFISGSDDFLEPMVYTMQSRTTCRLNRWSGVFEDNGRECRMFAKHGSSHRHLCLGEVCVGLHTRAHTRTHARTLTN